MNSPQNSTRVPENPSVTGLLIQNNTSSIADNTHAKVKTGQNLTGNPTIQPNNTTSKTNITAVKPGNSKTRSATPQSIKDQILAVVSEADIISHYVSGFKGIAGTFFNPLTPNEENKSLSIYSHQSGKGLFLHSKNTGHDAGDVFQFVADLKVINSRADFPVVCQAIIDDMSLNLLDSSAGTGKNVTAVSVSKVKAPLPAGKGILDIQTLPEYSDSFLEYWMQWKVTSEVLRNFGIQQVISNRDKSGKAFSYSKNIASLFIADDWEKIIVSKSDKKKEVYQNTGNGTYLFGLEQARESTSSSLVLCEGEKDLLVLAANGFDGVTLSSASARLKPEDVALINDAAGGRPVFIVYDNDGPGEKGACKNAELSSFHIATLPKEYNDIADYFAGGHTAEEFKALLLIPKQEAGEKKKGKPKLSGESAYMEEVRKLYNVKEREGQVIDLTIDRVHLLKCLHALGFRTYDLEDNTTTFVRVVDSVIRNVSPVVIQRAFFDWLNEAPKWIDGPRKIHRDRLLNKFYAGRDSFFSSGALTLLKKEDIVFFTDKRKEICFFFENGFVKCTDINWTLHKYTELKGYIWEEQIIKRKVNVSPPDKEFVVEGIVAKFIYNICGKEPDRFESMTTVLGYLLHHYFEGMTPAILFTDSSLKSGDNGRTGKTLVSQLLGYLKPTVELAGKSFQESERFKFQEVKANTQITVLNDLPKSFNLEILFNAITEGIKVEQKNKDPHKVRSKILLTTNAPIKVEGASGRDRLKEIELSDHYSDKHHVADDFKGKWFLSKNDGQFSPTDWDDYFNTFFFCCHNYLSKGLSVPKQINLNRRKLEHQTPEGFPCWMDEQFEQGKIKENDWVNSGSIYAEFLTAFKECQQHPRWKSARHFRKAIDDYAELSGKYEKLLDKESKRRSGSDYLIFFQPKRAL